MYKLTVYKKCVICYDTITEVVAAEYRIGIVHLSALLQKREDFVVCD